ncbi:hypothetical protein [Aeromicrobium fastidiosum]|nr:hypothetical protein [Aeromicrobium fastidiosum]MBP2390069.1 hypothetical protein [Aeromicrobium fastidiosum]
MDPTLERPGLVSIWICVAVAVLTVNIALAAGLLAHYLQEQHGCR